MYCKELQLNVNLRVYFKRLHHSWIKFLNEGAFNHFNYWWQNLMSQEIKPPDELNLFFYDLYTLI